MLRPSEVAWLSALQRPRVEKWGGHRCRPPCLLRLSLQSHVCGLGLWSCDGLGEALATRARSCTGIVARETADLGWRNKPCPSSKSYLELLPPLSPGVWSPLATVHLDSAFPVPGGRGPAVSWTGQPDVKIWSKLRVRFSQHPAALWSQPEMLLPSPGNHNSAQPPARGHLLRRPSSTQGKARRGHLFPGSGRFCHRTGAACERVASARSVTSKYVPGWLALLLAFIALPPAVWGLPNPFLENPSVFLAFGETVEFRYKEP